MNTNLEYGSVEQIEKYQLERLRALLSFLKNDSDNEFYQQKLGILTHLKSKARPT